MISLIIPCYWLDQSFIDMTQKCLDGIYATKGIDEVIVVDDGSPHKMEVSWANVIERTENGGYAKAVNTGIKNATGDVLIICNNDIEFIQHDWLDHLLKPLDKYDVSSIRTTDADGWEVEDDITEGDKFGSIWAVKRNVIDKVGILDESFGKGYFEDLDFHHRVELEGFKVAKNHAGLVQHHGQATFKALDVVDKAFYEARDKFKEKWGKVW